MSQNPLSQEDADRIIAEEKLRQSIRDEKLNKEKRQTRTGLAVILAIILLMGIFFHNVCDAILFGG